MGIPVNIEQLINGKSVEWERLEYKEGWNPEEIIHSICAFANDINNWGGGYIIVGVKEIDGVPQLPPVGIPQNSIDKIQKEIVQLCHMTEPYIQLVTYPTVFMEKHILVIWVPGGTERPYKAPSTLGEKAQKRYYIRKGSVSKIANRTEEESLIALTAKIPYDDRINHLAEIDDLDLGLIREYLHEVKSGLASEALNIPFKDLCEQMHIIGGTPEYLKPKNIGLLFFCKNPEKFIPCSRIEIVHFLDEAGDNFTEKIFEGPIHQQLAAALTYLKDNIIKEIVFKIPQQAQAKRYFNYPYEALEEAISNSVYHKSYDVQSPIEIRINPESIEILNFEGPTLPITNKDLQKERIVNRFYRNRRIGDFLKELHYTEGRSTGFPNIYKSIRKNESPTPKFETDENNSYFLSTFYIHKAFTKHDGDIDKLMEFCQTPRTSREILEFLGKSYHSYNLKKFIQPLVESFILIPTSEKNNDSNKKFVARIK